MAVLTPQTTYPDGTTLDLSGHNANVYSPLTGKGIMSEPNGGLEQVNLTPGFTVRAEHIMSEEAVLARSESTTIPMDVFSNGFGMTDGNDEVYVTIAGLAQRVYIPFDIHALMWEWSFFLAPFKLTLGTYGLTHTTYNFEMRVEIDGVNIEVERRFAPNTATNLGIGSPVQEFTNRERVGCTWYDLSYLQKNVSKGWHEIAVKLYLERPPWLSSIGVIPGYWYGPDQGADNAQVGVLLHSRATFGTRSCRAIMFK